MIEDYRLSINGHTLFARTFNPCAQGIPVLLLHGVMSSLPFWTEDLVEPFLPYGPCTALTLPGHFPAEFPSCFQPDDLSASGMAALLHAALRQISESLGMPAGIPALVAGHSTGGFAALALAVYYPGSVRGVASIAGFAQGRWGSWLSIYQWLARQKNLGRAAFWALLRLGSIRPLFRASAAYHTPVPRHRIIAGKITRLQLEQIIEENYQAFRSYDLRSMQAYFAAMSSIDILPELGQVRVPVLALCGDADPAVPPAQSARIAGAIPGAQLAVLRGGVGHMPFYQKPEDYRSILDAWLAQHFGPPAD